MIPPELALDRRGPFDLIGDVHGCCAELETLLEKLGYTYKEAAGEIYPRLYSHPQGRTAVFLGDLCDRGPRNLDALELVRGMARTGNALMVPGNHDERLLHWLEGQGVKVSFGLQCTLDELENIIAEYREPYKRELRDFLTNLPSHYLLDGGRLAAAHAGVKEEMQGRSDLEVRAFALDGEFTGERDELDLPVRHNWALNYRGKAMVVYGHTPQIEPHWVNNTINIDTGCVFGGKLTALRYPELEIVSVPAARAYRSSSQDRYPPVVRA